MIFIHYHLQIYICDIYRKIVDIIYTEIKKVYRPEAGSFIKNEIPMNFSKFLRTHFLQNTQSCFCLHQLLELPWI